MSGDKIKNLTDSKSKSRMPNFELMRIISMCLVVVLHFLGHGGVLSSLERGTVGYFVFWLIESFAYVAVNVFVLLSAYFMCDSKFAPSKALSFVIQVIFYSVLGVLAVCLLAPEGLGMKHIIKAITPLVSGEYWFATQWFLLLIFSPLLKRIMALLTKAQHLILIIVSLFFFSFVPTFVIWSDSTFGNGMDLAWFIALYFIAVYIKKYIGDLSCIKCFTLYLICSLLLTLSRVVISIMGFGSLEDILWGYNSPIVLVSSVAFFLVFKNLRMKTNVFSRFVLAVAPLSFGVYLLHDNILVRPILWRFLKPGYVFANYGAIATVGWLVAMVVLIFTAGCVVEKLRKIAFKLLMVKKLEAFADSIYKKAIFRLSK